jgi:hypothetical protein
MPPQAPHHYTAVAALRWAQVRGLGGDEALAPAVLRTRLGKVLEHEDFWENVLLFFINQPCPQLLLGGCQRWSAHRFHSEDHETVLTAKAVGRECDRYCALVPGKPQTKGEL